MGREKGRRKEREKVREGEGRKGGRLHHGFWGMETPLPSQVLTQSRVLPN